MQLQNAFICQENSAINLTFQTEGQILMNDVIEVSLNHSGGSGLYVKTSCNEHNAGCTTKNPPNPAQTL